jgi:aryl-alcohol dehydrogenase-like predicted oxidoreductase
LTIETRRLGKSGPQVSAIGLGCMGMSDLYGPAVEAASIETVRAALDAEITLFDSADFYGSGHNEMLLRRALQGRKREEYVVSIKFGALRDPRGGWLGVDTRPAAIKNFLACTLRRLGVEYVDIYRPTRLDPKVPVEETVGAMGEMVTAGYLKHVGLSEVGAETLRRAQAVHPISDLQIEYSLFSRGIEREILPTCRQLGIGVTAYGVLSRGLLSGYWTKERQVRDFRGILPRFRGENLERNLALVEKLRGFAERRGATVAQVALAWVLSRGAEIVPLVGARRVDQLTESLKAVELDLTSQDLAEIERLVPADAAAGARYDERGMAVLDSERSVQAQRG